MRDITPPTLTITAANDTLMLGATTTIDFTFSEAVTGFDMSDILLSGAGSISAFSGSGAQYSATYLAGQSVESETISVGSGAVLDAAGQSNMLAAQETLSVGGLQQTYGHYFASFSAVEVIDGSSAGDTLSFGDNVAHDQGSLSINGNGGDDIFTFGHGAAADDGSSIDINNLAGDQSYSFKNGAGRDGGSVSITAGDGDQSYFFGSSAGRYSGSVSITAGDGASSFTFGDDAARNGGTITLDLGDDPASDSVAFDGLVGNIIIKNFSTTHDSKVDVVVPATWSGSDDGSDIVFTQSDQTITFEGLTGGSTDPLDYFQ